MPLPLSILRTIEHSLGVKIVHSEHVSGGDINAARKLVTRSGTSYFIKYRSAPDARTNLEAEAAGLEAIGNSGAIAAPEVLFCSSVDGTAFLVMPYLASSQPQKQDWETLGRGLAALHKSTAPQFGWPQNNFIGALPQSNQHHEDWATFYARERLLPQMEQAKPLLDPRLYGRGLKVIDKLPELVPREIPALIHGDLWGGNKLFTKDGPVLIDPAACHASREMDIAMSMLFGGFASAFYDAYTEAFPLEAGWEERMSLYQLYYLLVHVNIFGRSYASGVESAIGQYL